MNLTKRLTTLALSVTLLASLAISSNAAGYTLGDANGDKKVNVKDAMTILKHVANWNTVISETQYYYELLPRITGISDTELESYTENFGEVKSAVLYRDGEEIAVSKDDPKLIRLLNLLANDVKHLGGLAEFVPLY